MTPADSKTRFFPLGDSALTVEFGNVILEELNVRAIALADRIREAGFPGLIETVPAYASASVFYDPAAVKQGFPEYSTAYDAVLAHVQKALDDIGEMKADGSDPIVVPVDFSDAAGPDLAFVAKRSGLPASDVISIFTAAIYRVYMLGFLPGFTYMGEVDARIATPRKETPRTEVPKGSIGIAGTQTGIYSLASPGGWQIIGRTDIEMFPANLSRPCRFNPGDIVRFEALK